MKQNKYDNPSFFQKYSNFPRSVHGLMAAGEWPQMQKMLPNFKDKSVLDIGCGFGWHCVYAASQGAKSVLGIDISEKMLKVAAEKNEFENVRYNCLAMEDINSSLGKFDIVLSSLAFHYTPNFMDICNNVYNILENNGNFIFSVEHPIFTSNELQDFNYVDSKIDNWPIRNYFYEGEINTLFLGENIIKYHRTLTTYLSSLLKVGFHINDISEPTPTEQCILENPGMKNELMRPMMLIISAGKK